MLVFNYCYSSVIHTRDGGGGITVVAAGQLRQDKYQSIVLYKVVMSDNVPHFFQLERSGNGHKQAVWC